MPRLIKSPNSGSTIVNAVTPAQGGHGEVTAPDALEAMDLVPRNSIGKFGRPIPLDGDGYIDQRYLQDLYATMETVSGDLTIEVNQTKEYFLTGYDAFSVYDVRAVSGMVSIDRNVITYTAPGEPGQGGFTINGRMVAVTVTEVNAVEGIAPPVMLTPVRGTAGLTGPVSVTSSAFVTDNAETHVSTSWQCAEDPGFTVIVASVDQSTTHKTSWSIGTVMLGKHYFIRAKYHGSGGGVSPWSEETHFTSPVPTPADRPVITSPVNGAARLPSRVTLTSSTYNTVTGDPHVSTSWEISESPLFTNLAFQNINSAVDKTSWMVSGLQPAKEYYARVRYRGQLHEYTEWSPTSAFRTRLAFLPETEIGKSGTYNGVSADMDDTGGRWIVGSGSFSTPGVNCAAYIYRRDGGVPVLEDTIQAVAGQKNMVTTIPAGGQLEVTVNGRYTSTKSYTQAEEIIVPAGAQTLTLVGKGSSSNEVTAFVIGNGSVQIPAGTTSLKLIGKGSDGTTIYNPGQPYIAPIPGSPETASFSASLSPNFNTATYSYGIGGPATGTGYKDTNGEWIFTGTAPSETYPVDSQGNATFGNRMALEYFGIVPSGLGGFVLTARYSGGLTYTGSITLDSMVIVPGTPGTAGQPYIAPSTTTTNGISATMTIQGQTYTYPGGLGGPATPRTDNITLNGTAQALTYNIPTGGNGQYGYPGSTGVSQSLAGTGEYILPLGTPEVVITAKGGDGTSVYNPGQTYIAPTGNSAYPGGLPAYNPGQPYIAPTAGGYQAAYINYNSNDGNSYGFPAQIWFAINPDGTGYPYGPSSIQSSTGITANLSGATAHSSGFGSVTYTTTSGWNVSYAGTVPIGTGSSGQPYIAPTGNSAYPGGLPAYNPGQAYIAPSTTYTTGASTTVTIKDRTFTFAGGYGGPATVTTQEITLDGSDLSMNYSIPTTGSGVVEYSVSTVYSRSFTGNGSHNVPADVTTVSITAKGGDGTTHYYPGQSYVAAAGNPSYPSGLPPYSSGTATYSGTISGTYQGQTYSGIATATWTKDEGSTYGVLTITSYPTFTLPGIGESNPVGQTTFMYVNFSDPLDITLTYYAGYNPIGSFYSYPVTGTLSRVSGTGTPSGDPSYPDGLPPYTPGQPYIPPSTVTTNGAESIVTVQGQTYTYPGGVGGPATSRNDVVNVTAGSIKPLNYTVPQGGVVSLSYTTAVTPARETTATINGQTYTFSGSNSGAATNTTYTLSLVDNNAFANAVAMNQDGTLAAICSSPKIGSTAGYVLVLQRSGTSWDIVDELNRVDGLVWHAQSVSMDKTGNYILVGADAQPVGATKIGSFAIYRRQAGKYAVEQTVIAPDPGVAYEAGSSVSLSGNASIAVIGAPAGGVASRTLVYERDNVNTFVLTATLSKTTDPHSADSFGTRIYISADGTTIAASSPTSRGVNTTHANCGEVIIFRKVGNVWTKVSTVRHPTPTSGLYFGQDLHLSDDGFTLSVGVPGGTGGLGEVMFFDIEGSTVTYKSNVVSSAVAGGTNFGKAIALTGHSGDLVGASKFGTYVFD